MNKPNKDRPDRAGGAFEAHHAVASAVNERADQQTACDEHKTEPEQLASPEVREV